MDFLPLRYLPVSDLSSLQDLFQRPLGHDFAAMNARTGADFEDVIRRPNRVGVVLDHDHGIAQIAQPFQRLDHFDVVFGMQPDARLVKHVQHSHEAGPDLRRQPDSLRFAARESRGTAIQAEIIEPDRDQQFQSRGHFAHDRLGDRSLSGRRLDRSQEFEQLGEVHLAELEEIAAADRDETAGALEAGAAAFRAVVFDHHFLQVFVHAGVRRALFAVLAIVMLQLIHDAIELDLLAGMLLP